MHPLVIGLLLGDGKVAATMLKQIKELAWWMARKVITHEWENEKVGELHMKEGCGCTLHVFVHLF